MKNHKKIEVRDYINEFSDDTAYIFTHKGIFHGDEITASIIYAMSCKYENIVIVRIARDDAEQMNLAENRENAIIVDMGGGKYDHHSGTPKQRPTEGTVTEEKAVNFASAGLVWRDFGKHYIKKLIIQLIDNPEERYTILNDENLISELYKKIDADIIQPIDARDNGKPIQNKREITEFFEDFYPDFYDENPNYNEAFLKTLKTVQIILDYEIKQTISLVLRRKGIKCDILDSLEDINKTEFKRKIEEYINNVIREIQSYCSDINQGDFVEVVGEFYTKYCKYGDDIVTNVVIAKINRIKNKYIANPFLKKRIQDDRYFSNGILEIPAQITPWTDFALEYNEDAELSQEQQINFVLYPYPSGGWALQCVPPSREDLWGKRISLYNDKTLDLTIHPNLFFARGNSRQDLEKLASNSVKKNAVAQTHPTVAPVEEYR